MWSMIEINWNPVAHVGPIPINWYGLGWAAAFLIGWRLTSRCAPRHGIGREHVEDIFLWILLGTMAGARLYFIVQNDSVAYLREPWRIFAIWEGGLAFFGGLFGGILGGYLYARRHGLRFGRVADVFAPAIAIGAAIGRIPCGFAGMDYGTPTRLRGPWSTRIPPAMRQLTVCRGTRCSSTNWPAI
jgi:phosphatidylglycerol:prolipoprotein diacylglycerol transferase